MNIVVGGNFLRINEVEIDSRFFFNGTGRRRSIETTLCEKTVEEMLCQGRRRGRNWNFRRPILK